MERKQDFSPVTVADREAEQQAVAVLHAAFPDYGVLGEEFGAEVPLAALVPQPATQAQAAPQVAARPAVSQL